MSATNKQLLVNTVNDLNQLTALMAPRLKGGETIELVSDLGGGKTAFVRCLMSHLLSQDAVSSPSFTIENIYRCPQFNIHHFDFYRLEQAGICEFELAEALADDGIIVIVEWSQIVKDLLPKDRLTIAISPQPHDDWPQRRLFNFKTTLGLAYLLVDL